VVGLVVGGLLIAPGLARAQWTSESIPGAGVASPLGLSFDGAGRGLFTWEGFDQSASPQRFTAADARAASGVWSREPSLAGLTWGGAQVSLYGVSRALLVARQTSSIGAFDRACFRLVYAFGRSDGSFDGFHRLAEGVSPSVVSAVNRAGAGLIAWADARTGATWISERAAGATGFSRPRRVAAGGVGAAAIDARGDRVLAWWGRAGVYARVARAGRGFGPALLAAGVTPVADTTLRAVLTPGGRVVLAWATADVREDRPVGIGAGVALRDGGGGWRSYRLEQSTVPSAPFAVGTPAVPIIDSGGRAFVAFTGVSVGTSVVEVARITAGGARDVSVVSGAVAGASVEDAAAGPRGSVVVAWSAPATLSHTIVYASLRRGGGAFAQPERLTPDGVAGIAGSRAAFAPLTGQAVVTWSAVGADGRIGLHAAVSPPG
jgi:hypothetical protein